MISSNKKQRKKEQTENRNNFYLSFFEEKDATSYAEKEVNGYWIVRSYNTDSKQTQAALYSQDSFRKYKSEKSG